MATSYSGLRVEIAVRAAMIAKAALEIVGMEPRLAQLQLNEVARQIHELATTLRNGPVAPSGGD